VAWDAPDMFLERGAKRADPASKVPLDAKLVHDEAGLAKELADLKSRLKDTMMQNESLGAQLRTTQSKMRDVDAERDKIMLAKRMVVNPVTGQLEPFNA